MHDQQSGSVVTLSRSDAPFWRPRRLPPVERREVGERHHDPFDVSSAYDEHGASLFGFAINALRDRELAEDCVQETFLKAWRARERFDTTRASTRTWLFAIARNVIIDMQRSSQRTPRIADSAELDDVADVGIDELERLRVLEALSKLSPEHRLVITAVHVNGETYSELAARTGVAAATLRTRAFYGLRALRAHLDPTEDRNPS